MSVRKVRTKRGWAVSFVVSTVKPLVLMTTRHTWIDGEKIPATGGCMLVLNHVSHADPLITAHFVYDHGRIPRYLAKSELFRAPVIGKVLTSAHQIPVERFSRGAIGAYDAAVRAVNDGECLVVYPEGTLTRDPELWPMAGKSGAARIALATGVPVIPVAHWGAQDVLYPYASKPRLVPRQHITMKVGDPVDIDDLRGVVQTPQVVNETTDRIMKALTVLVSELRGEQPPPVRFDLSKASTRRCENPNKKDTR